MRKTPNFRTILTGFLRLFSVFRNKLFRRRRSVKYLNQELEKLQQLNQSKDQLFAIVSHDLRSVVHSLQISIAQLKTQLAQANIKEAMLMAGNIEQTILSLQSLLNNLLYWSLSQTGQLNFYPEKFSVQRIVNQVCYDFLPIAPSKSIALYYTLASDLFCNADINSVRLILRNIIDNAIKYTPAQGAITIAARQENNYCYIMIQDTGIGISREVIEALFAGDTKRIQQEASGKQSTGIGLWLAKNMTQRNGGSLRIFSETGMGTMVRIALPVNA